MHLQALLQATPSLATQPLQQDPVHTVPPLHYVCDVVFNGQVTQEQSLALTNALLDAGVNVDESYAKSGDTFLITATSLGAESVGLRLLEHGADVTPTGLFNATALHWAAFVGLDRLGHALIQHGAAIELRDTEYDCTPLQWSLHAWAKGPEKNRDGVPRITRVLVEHGAQIPDGALDSLTKDADAAMRDALKAH